ncbi:unnamed protein product [Rotaria sp. Silwood1]|nr:unnamed protein product [Rotaria sp. Silwood1]
MIMQQNDRVLAEYYAKVQQETNGDEAAIEKILASIRVMGERKRIGLAAHNEKKSELIECLKKHRKVLVQHKLYATGTTGTLVEKELNIPVRKFESGPLGGDQRLGAKIAKNELDILIFLIDPLSPHAHNADVEALVRLAQVYKIPCATNATSVDFLLTSSMMSESSVRTIPVTGYPQGK